MQHFALSISHIALQFRQQSNSCSCWHRLEHILLPVLTHSSLRNFCCKVAGNNLALFLICYHRQHPIAEGVDGIIEFLSLTISWREHHVVGRFLIFLIADVTYIAVFAISLYYDSLLQTGSKVVERIAHLADLLSLVIPFLRLLRIGFHLLLEGLVDSKILLRRVAGCTIQAFLHNRESVEHLIRDIQCQHSHQDDIHQIDHLLAWRNWSFLDCHSR